MGDPLPRVLVPNSDGTITVVITDDDDTASAFRRAVARGHTLQDILESGRFIYGIDFLTEVRDA